jgi:hypothetical protein
MVENNIPQNIELGYPQVVVSFFGGHQSLHQAWFASKNSSL